MIHVVALRLGLHILWWSSVAMLLFRTRGYIASFLFAAVCTLSGIHFGPSLDFNLQLTGVIVLAPIGFLVLGHLDRRPLWGVPAAIISAAAILAKFNVGVACFGSIVVWAIIQLCRNPGRRIRQSLALVAASYGSVLVGLFRIYGGPINARVIF